MLLRTTPAGLKTSAPRRGGFVIVAVLMVVTVLSLAAYQYSALMDAEVMAAERIRKTAESRAAADSAIHYAMGYLADKNAFSGTLNSNPFDNPSFFQGVLVKDGSTPKTTARFSIVTPDYRQDISVGSLPLVYGLTDEAGKINVNALFAARLVRQGAPRRPDEAAEHDRRHRLVDRRLDRPGRGAEPGRGRESVLRRRSRPRTSARTARSTRSRSCCWSRASPRRCLFGTDRNRNGKLDPGEDDGSGFNLGWAAYLTVYSREQNVDSDGNPRINLNGNDLQQLQNDLTAVGRAGPGDVHPRRTGCSAARRPAAPGRAGPPAAKGGNARA